MEKNIVKNFENQNIAQENNFDSIKITLASPEIWPSKRLRMSMW